MEPDDRLDPAELADLAATLPWALDAAPMPAGMRERVLAKATAEPAAPPVLPPVLPPAAPPRLTLVHDATREAHRDAHKAPSDTWRAAATVAAAGLLASLALNVYFWGHVGSLSGQLVELRAQREGQEAKLASMQLQAESRAAQIAVLQARDTRMAKLPGLTGAEGASAMLFWSPTEKAWLVSASGLPPVQAGKTYQLWAVTADGQKISMGVFPVDAAGAATVRMNMPRPDMRAAAAAVSLEPAGGMPQPTGPIVMMGELKI